MVRQQSLYGEGVFRTIYWSIARSSIIHVPLQASSRIMSSKYNLCGFKKLLKKYFDFTFTLIIYCVNTTSSEFIEFKYMVVGSPFETFSENC